jgi:hypothetical protein
VAQTVPMTRPRSMDFQPASGYSNTRVHQVNTTRRPLDPGSCLGTRRRRCFAASARRGGSPRAGRAAAGCSPEGPALRGSARARRSGNRRSPDPSALAVCAAATVGASPKAAAGAASAGPAAAAGSTRDAEDDAAARVARDRPLPPSISSRAMASALGAAALGTGLAGVLVGAGAAIPALIAPEALVSAVSRWRESAWRGSRGPGQAAAARLPVACAAARSNPPSSTPRQPGSGLRSQSPRLRGGPWPA